MKNTDIIKKFKNITETFEDIKLKSDSVSLNALDYYHLVENNVYNGTEFKDWTKAFEQIALDISSSSAKTKKLVLPRNTYYTTKQITFNNIWSLTIEGESANSTVVKPIGIASDKSVFRIVTGSFAGASITGLLIKDIYFDFLNSDCHGIVTGSLNDNCIFENLHFRNIVGNSIRLETKLTETPTAYNFLEGVIFRNVVTIGCNKTIKTSNAPILRVVGSGGANEIFVHHCKFYMNPDSSDPNLLNPRPAITVESYAHGWEITGCHFLGSVNSKVISFGYNYSGATAVNSNSHRIFSNSFENMHDNGFITNLIYLTDSDKNVANTQNFIGFNRFENVKCNFFYILDCNNTTVFETGIIPQKVKCEGFKNNIMCMKPNDDKAIYHNSFLQSNSLGYNISSNLTICSRGDIQSNEISNLKPSLILGHKQNNETLKEDFKLELRNEMYQQAIVDLIANNSRILTFYNGQMILNPFDTSVNELAREEGSIIYDKVSKKFKGYNGTEWVILG